MFAFLKKLYLKVRNFFAINTAKAIRSAQRVMAAGNKDSWMKWLGGLGLLIAIAAAAFLVAYVFAFAVMFCLISAAGSIGLIIGYVLCFVVINDTIGTTLKLADEASKVASHGEEAEKTYFATLDAIAAAI